MKLLAFLLTLFFCCTSMAGMVGQSDKAIHAGVSALMFTGVYIYFRSVKYSKQSALGHALLITIGIGLAKELGDQTFDWSDMGANALGATGMVVPVLMVDF